MKFYKIALSTDLSMTTYRCWGQIENSAYIEYNDGFIDPSWEEISEEDIQLLFPEWFNIEENENEQSKELTQLDVIEALLYEVILNQDND